MGLFPSKVGVQDTLTDFGIRGARSAFTLVGAYGSSITSSRAERVSFPPEDRT